MMDLKKLLGNKYRDDMTATEIAEVLAGYDPTAGMVKKDLLEKANSEAAKYKKELNAKMTAVEQEEADRRAAQEKMEAELAELKRDKAISEYRARLLGLGYEETLAANTAQAFADGNLDVVFANQRKHQQAQEKALRAKLLEETPKPPAGNSGNVTINYAKEIESAQAAGDFSKAAYYTRLQGMEEIQNNKGE